MFQEPLTWGNIRPQSSQRPEAQTPTGTRAVPEVFTAVVRGCKLRGCPHAVNKRPAQCSCSRQRGPVGARSRGTAVPARCPLTFQVGDHRLVLVLQLGEALRFLLLFHEIGGKLGYSVFQKLLLLRGEVGQRVKLVEHRTLEHSSKYNLPGNLGLNQGEDSNA